MLRRIDQDVGFWLERAREAVGPVLELACGTGRLTLALAEAGVAIVGLDKDLVMLAAADQRWKSRGGPGAALGPLWVAADMRQFALARRFAMVFVGYNSLQLLSGPPEMTACLGLAGQHLAPGGLVGVEVTDFQRGGADGPDDHLVPLADAEGIRLSGTLGHHLASRTSRYRRHFAGAGWAVDNDVVVRSVDRPELESIFRAAGLTPVRWWVDGPTVRAVAAPQSPG